MVACLLGGLTPSKQGLHGILTDPWPGLECSLQSCTVTSQAGSQTASCTSCLGQADHFCYHSAMRDCVRGQGTHRELTSGPAELSASATGKSSFLCRRAPCCFKYLLRNRTASGIPALKMKLGHHHALMRHLKFFMQAVGPQEERQDR